MRVYFDGVEYDATKVSIFYGYGKTPYCDVGLIGETDKLNSRLKITLNNKLVLSDWKVWDTTTEKNSSSARAYGKCMAMRESGEYRPQLGKNRSSVPANVLLSIFGEFGIKVFAAEGVRSSALGKKTALPEKAQSAWAYVEELCENSGYTPFETEDGVYLGVGYLSTGSKRVVTPDDVFESSYSVTRTSRGDVDEVLVRGAIGGSAYTKIVSMPPKTGSKPESKKKTSVSGKKEKEATEIAKQILAETAMTARTISIGMIWDPEYSVGDTVELKGFKFNSGEYFLRDLQVEFTPNGDNMNLTLVKGVKKITLEGQQ